MAKNETTWAKGCPTCKYARDAHMSGEVNCAAKGRWTAAVRTCKQWEKGREIR